MCCLNLTTLSCKERLISNNQSFSFLYYLYKRCLASKLSSAHISSGFVNVTVDDSACVANALCVVAVVVFLYYFAIVAAIQKQQQHPTPTEK